MCCRLKLISFSSRDAAVFDVLNFSQTSPLSQHKKKLDYKKSILVGWKTQEVSWIVGQSRRRKKVLKIEKVFQFNRDPNLAEE